MPVDVPVSSIQALPEGLLIEWCKDQEFNYFILSKHPLSNITPLGIMRSNEVQDVDVWLDSNEQIVYTNRYLPLIVSYNHLLQRHAIQLIRRHQTSNNEDYLEQIYFPSLLSKACQPQVICELYYEESTKENMIKKCKLLKGSEQEIIICMLYGTAEGEANYVKLLSLSIVNINSKQKSESLSSTYILNSLKVVQVLHNVQSICGFNIFSSQPLDSYPISVTKHQFKLQAGTQSAQYQMLLASEQNLKNCLIVYHKNKKFTLLFGSKVLVTYQIQTSTLNETKEKYLKSTTISIINYIDGKLMISQKNGLNELICFPQITDKLLISALKAIQIVTDSQQFSLLLRDVLINCLNLSIYNIEIEDNNQSKQSLSDQDEFTRFTYYIIFMLKLCGGTKIQLSEDHIQKKVKPTLPIQEESSKAQQYMITSVKNSSDSQIYKKYCHSKHPQPVAIKTIPQKFLMPKFDMTLTMFTQITEKIFYALHLLYQDQQLTNKPIKLLYLLYCFALNLDSEHSQSYTDYYLRKEPNLTRMYKNDQVIPILPTLKPLAHLSPSSERKENFLNLIPIDFYQWVQNLYDRNNSTFPILFQKTKDVCTVMEYIVQGKLQQRTISIPRFLLENKKFITSQQSDIPLLFNNNDAKKQNENTNYQNQDNEILAFLTIIEKQWDRSMLLSLPLCIRVPILEMISTFKNYPERIQHLYGKKSCQLIGREDIYRNWKLYSQPEKQKKHFKKYVDLTIRGQKANDKENDDDEYLTNNQLKYPQQVTIYEVLRLFEYQRDLAIKGKFTEHIAEDKLEQEGQVVLQKLLNRRIAVFVGMGALQYGNSEHFITEQVRFPGINTSGIIVQNGVKLTLDHTRDDMHNYQQWPEFHLGVSLALQLSRKLRGLSHDSLRTWIFYQKPSQPTNIYGGFMYGLGLLGYLDALNQIDIYHLLTMNLNQQSSNECTQVGVLLGIGASRLGKCDEVTQKSLSVHIPSLIPSVLDLELPPNVPTSALCSLGLLFLGSGNRNFTEVALGLIGRKPTNDKIIDREGHSLAAGVTLGLINLGRGSVWKNELQIEERLIRFIQGGTVIPPPQSTLSTTFTQTEGHISSIKEGNMVNIHVTCPGALMGLCLIFLQSGNYNVVQKLSIPQNFSELEQCNPNHTLLKSFTKNMIMWNDIPIKHEGIQNQIPEIVRFLFEQPLKRINQKYYLVYNTEVIDFMSVAQIYTGIISGCLLAIGIKYAGTHDKDIKLLILQEMELLMKVKIAQNELANDPENKNSVEQYTYFTNAVNSLVSVSLVMAGSFDDEVFQQCKKLRKRLEQLQIWHFGFHQAISFAIGLLHLGKGAYSFSKTLQSIALLTISVYPYYPSSPGDNKQYLQVLRWFYVMAIKPKTFKTVDVQSNQLVSVKAEFKTKNQEIHNTHQEIHSVSVNDENYFPLNLDLDPSKKSIQLLYLQKKIVAKENTNTFSNLSITNSLQLFIEQLKFKEQESQTIQKLQEGLKNLKEWKLISQLLNNIDKDKQSTLLPIFTELLNNDNLDFIQAISDLINQQNRGQSLQLLISYYKNKNNNSNLVLTLQCLQDLQNTFGDQSFPSDILTQYVKNLQLSEEQHSITLQIIFIQGKLFLFLQQQPFPTFAEIKMIKQFTTQLPKQDLKRCKQILQFYLMKTYKNPKLANFFINVLLE